MKFFFAPTRVIIFIKFTLVIALGGCFNISDIYQEAFDKFTNSDVTKFLYMGSQIILEKKIFYEKGDSNYLSTLDSINLKSEAERLSYQEYFNKYFNNLEATISQAKVILVSNDKKVTADIIYRPGYENAELQIEGDDELFFEKITDFKLKLDYKFRLEGDLNGTDDRYVLLNEKNLIILKYNNGKMVDSRRIYD